MGGFLSQAPPTPPPPPPPEELDENYEPTPQEVEEYAEWLGMSREEDCDLFYIAKEGLKAPLPKPWKPCQSADSEIFYFNFETLESTWEHPCDEYYRKLFNEEKAKRQNGGVADGVGGGESLKSKKKKKEEAEKGRQRAGQDFKVNQPGSNSRND